MAKDKLTSKQRLFCIEYVKNHNGTEAAINAGYSEKSAQPIASENLLKPIIIEKIKQLEENTEEDLRIYFIEESDEAIQDLLIMRNKIKEQLDKKEEYSDKDNKLLMIRKDINKEILYLAGHKPTDNISITEKKLEDLL